LTDTPSWFGSRRRHIQGIPSQLLDCQHVKWFPATVRPRVTEMRPSLTIRCFWSFLAVALTITVLRYWNMKILKASLMEPRINKTQWILSWLQYVVYYLSLSHNVSRMRIKSRTVFCIFFLPRWFL
jgi:hypothetical protein